MSAHPAFVQLPQLSIAVPHFQTGGRACIIRRPRSFLTASSSYRRILPTAASEKPGASFDYYKVLDLQEDADATAIKRAYRRAALKNHPDVSEAPDARDRFLRVQEAYSVLSDSSKRAEYDRRRRAAPAGSPFDAFGNFGDFDKSTAADFARRWREKNPMPEDINDNFGSIFSDLFSGVANAFGSGASASSGVVEDFIEFLEKRVDGFVSPRSSSSDTGDDALLSTDEDVLRAEIDDARFVIEQLQQRRRKAQNEGEELRNRVREWTSRAERAGRQRDFHTRVAAEERRDELLKQTKRLSRRVEESDTLIRQQKDRLMKLEARLVQVQNDARKSPKSVTDETSYNSSSSEPARLKKRSTINQEAIDDELERMKRELGLS